MLIYIKIVIIYGIPEENPIYLQAGTKDWKSIDNGYPDAYFVQLGQIENGANERAVSRNVKTAFSFTPSSILT